MQRLTAVLLNTLTSFFSAQEFVGLRQSCKLFSKQRWWCPFLFLDPESSTCTQKLSSLDLRALIGLRFVQNDCLASEHFRMDLSEQPQELLLPRLIYVMRQVHPTFDIPDNCLTQRLQTLQLEIFPNKGPQPRKIDLPLGLVELELLTLTEHAIISIEFRSLRKLRTLRLQNVRLSNESLLELAQCDSLVTLQARGPVFEQNLTISVPKNVRVLTLRNCVNFDRLEQTEKVEFLCYRGSSFDSIEARFPSVRSLKVVPRMFEFMYLNQVVHADALVSLYLVSGNLNHTILDSVILLCPRLERLTAEYPLSSARFERIINQVVSQRHGLRLLHVPGFIMSAATHQCLCDVTRDCQNTIELIVKQFENDVAREQPLSLLLGQNAYG